MVIAFLIAFVAGVIMLYFEIKQRRVNTQLLSNYISDIKDNKSLNHDEKSDKLVDLLTANGFKVIHRDETKVQAMRKDKSVALILIGFGFFGVGAVIYLGYYFFIQKPRMYEIFI